MSPKSDRYVRALDFSAMNQRYTSPRRHALNPEAYDRTGVASLPARWRAEQALRVVVERIVDVSGCGISTRPSHRRTAAADWWRSPRIARGWRRSGYYPGSVRWCRPKRSARTRSRPLLSRSLALPSPRSGFFPALRSKSIQTVSVTRSTLWLTSAAAASARRSSGTSTATSAPVARSRSAKSKRLSSDSRSAGPTIR